MKWVITKEVCVIVRQVRKGRPNRLQKESAIFVEKNGGVCVCVCGLLCWIILHSFALLLLLSFACKEKQPSSSWVNTVGMCVHYLACHYIT